MGRRARDWVIGPGRAGRRSFGLLVTGSRPLSGLVLAWVVVSALVPALVLGALGLVVGEIPAALRDGTHSHAAKVLVIRLVVAALLYGFSLILDPIADALSTSAQAVVTGDVQHRLLVAVNAPVGIGHLEDPESLDRLARAEGSLTGFFPGDAPVTWASVLSSRLSGFVACLVLASFSWQLAVVSAAVWLAVRRALLTAVIRQTTELRSQTTAMRRAWYFTSLGNKARDAKEVRVFGWRDFIADRYTEEFLASLRHGAPGLARLHRIALICGVAVLALYAATLTEVAHAGEHHTISLARLATLLPLLSLSSSLGSISFDDVTLAATLDGLPDIEQIEADLTGSALVGATPVPGRLSVTLRDVRFGYPGAATDVLRGVDLDLAAGTSTAIVGINGAGKTTLVNLLARMRDPSGGQISVDGVPLADVEPVAWQRQVAVVLQQPVHYPLSLYDNISLGSLENAADLPGVTAAAEAAGLTALAESLPRGWDTVLAPELPGGVDLSGGQWQRVALARAIFATRHGARLLILDEPTASLDVRGEADFYGRFLEITHGLTTVLISHRFATVRQATRICVLDAGVITEQGSHAELVAADGQYARMYAVQAARFAETRP